MLYGNHCNNIRNHRSDRICCIGSACGDPKNMDVFGVCVLGLSTAVGGGVIRDLILGETPPAMFTNPTDAIAGLATCLFILIPEIRTMVERSEFVLLLADAVGFRDLHGIWNYACSGNSRRECIPGCFVGVVTGVGGGLLRDVMASVPPYIFTKDVDAVASIAGGILLCVIYPYVDKYIGLFITSAFVVVLRLLASRFRWEIPKAEDVSLHHTKNHSGKE